MKTEIRADSNAKSRVLQSHSAVTRMKSSSSIKASASLISTVKSKDESNDGHIRAFLNGDLNFRQESVDNGFFKAFIAPDPNLRIRARLSSKSNFTSKYTDKFAGVLTKIKALNGFNSQQKIYPTGDIITNINGSKFVDKNLRENNLFQSIDEGVFTGQYVKQSGISFRVSDDSNSYIHPSATATEGTFRYKCSVNPVIIKPNHSFLFMRAAAPLKNYGSDAPPEYTISNIKLEDPSGNLIVKYKDFKLRGDSDYDDVVLRTNYSTYISEPEINNGALRTYDNDYPLLGSGYGDSSHFYTLSMDFDIACLDDPFNTGFSSGYEEYDCSLKQTNNPHDDDDYLALDGSPLSTRTQGFTLNPTNSIRISAIEVCNSGYQRTGDLAPAFENTFNMFLNSQSKGERITKNIFPARVMPKTFDTSIYPSVQSTWQSSAYPDETHIVSNDTNLKASGLFLADKIADNSMATYLKLIDSSIANSGKLIVEFQDQSQTRTGNFIGREFSAPPFNLSFDESRFYGYDIDDAYVGEIETVSLKVVARKNPSKPNYSLDVVGYSNDKILFVTSPSGGFLQNPSGGLVVDSNVTSTVTQLPDSLGISTESISDKDNNTVTVNTISNSGGDHFILTQSPVIDSVGFKEYTIPLEIYKTQPFLGAEKRYDTTRYFKNLFLDIYPISASGDIADIRLEITYRPQNSIGLHAFGTNQNETLQRSNLVLNIDQSNSDSYIFNHGKEFARLSQFDNLPHAYQTSGTVKSNYSRRWRGVSGKEYYSPYSSEFDYGFNKDEVESPFPSGYYSFKRYDSQVVYDDVFAGRSGIYQGLSSSSIHKNIGWRFSSDHLFSSQVSSYKTTDWTTNGHELYGQIADAFDSAIRISGVNGYLNFGNEINTSGSFSAFVRFSPDSTVSGVNYNLWDSGVIFSKYQNNLDFALAYKDGYLCAYAKDNAGNIVESKDTDLYSTYQYPLSVLVTYGNGKLKLYTDNELDTTHNILRATSTDFVKVDNTDNLTLGYSAGSGVGMNMFVSEFGISPYVIQETSSTVITAEDLFASSRMMFSSGNKIDAKDKMWFYLRDNIEQDWQLRDFRSCQFDDGFNRLTLRADKEHITHNVKSDGSAYSSFTDISLPSSLNADSVSYHTQVENDFIRFNIEDAPSVEASGKLYAAATRITCALPRGYNFSEEAIAVDTILEHDIDNLVSWSDGQVGPQLIVSLYSPKLVPTHYSADSNLGLITRKVHYLEPSGCIRGITTTFDEDSYLDDDTPWFKFNRDKPIDEFDKKYYSSNVNDMFLQYDIAYPSGTAYDSTIKLHSSHVRLKDSLRYPAFSESELPLYVSGEKVARGEVSFISFGHDVSEESLSLYNSGLVPETFDSSTQYPSGLALFISGVPLANESMGLFHPGAIQTVDSSNLAQGMFGSDNNFGLPIYVEGRTKERARMPIHVDGGGSANPSGSIPLVSFSTVSVRDSLENNLGLFSEGVSPVDNNPNASLPLLAKLTDRFVAWTFDPLPIYITGDSERPSASANLSLYSINRPFVDPNLTEQIFIEWNGRNVGDDILAIDNAYASIPANDEIRGVITTCYGECGYVANCIPDIIETHDQQWTYSTCVDGGIARAKSTYTNVDVGYNGNYYGIRKYTGLIPSYPYEVTIKGFTGDNQLMDLPKVVETVEYGSNDEVNFSGIKLFTDNPDGLNAKYGKDVCVLGDLMAIGAPDYTLHEGSKQLDKSGAVFLYGRSPAPTGYDWSNQDDKGNWVLEDILTLPDGFKRDWYESKSENVGTFNEPFYAPINKWKIGNYGRNFGNSVDIVKDPKDSSKYVVAVGAPNGKFDREFVELSPRMVDVLMLVVTDEFKGFDYGEGGVAYKASDLYNAVDNRNKYFTVYSSPMFNVNLKVIVLEATKNTLEPFKDFVNPTTFVSRFNVNRMLRSRNMTAQERAADQRQQANVIKAQILEAFEEVFPHDGSKPNSNIPAYVGYFVDDSASFPSESIQPAFNEFLDFYKEYSYASGLLDWQSNPISGVVVDSKDIASTSENWIQFTSSAIHNMLDNDNILAAKDVFTSGYGIPYNTENIRFNTHPASGGRVYIFEKQNASSGLFYNNATGIWNITQVLGDDLYATQPQHRDSFGFSLSFSDDSENLAVGSPFNMTKGARVYEKDISYSDNNLYNSVSNWLNDKATEEAAQGNILSVYQKLYTEYSQKLSEGFNTLGAGRHVYETLNPSGRFSLLNYNDPTITQKYKEVFSYKNDYNYGGTWSLIPERFAPKPRVGYSVALNEDASIFAIGCPTDSMNQWDDANVWYKNIKVCDEETNSRGMRASIGGYDSPYKTLESSLQGVISGTITEGNWESYTNAGAVQLFESRRYYPHDKVVEYGIFGNKHEYINDASNVEKGIRSDDFNHISGVFDSLSIPFVKTVAEDPYIPTDAGLLFIITPLKEPVSQEVLQNIKDWLALGDRNLVIVGDDPVWEADSEYAESNRILNKLLRDLGSRLKLYPAKRKEHSLYQRLGNTHTNVIPATIPEGSIDTYVNTGALFGSGVADIRLYDPAMSVVDHGCDTGQFQDDLQLASTFLSQEEQQILFGSDVPRVTFDTANIGCQPSIGHEGDLRAQWYELCQDIKRNYHRVPRNLPVAYGRLPGMTDPLCDKGTPCDKAKDCEWSAGPKKDYPPRPILAAAEQPPPFEITYAGTPESTSTIISHYERVLIDTTRDKLFGTKFDEPVFNFDCVLSSSDSLETEYSGNYTDLDTNYLNGAADGGAFFKPEYLDKCYALQSNNVTFEKPDEEDVLVEEYPYIAVEQKHPEYDSSSLILIASTVPETKSVLTDGDDSNIYFYRNILTRNDQKIDTTEMSSANIKHVNVAQLGGWTKRTKFTDGYKESFIYRKTDGGAEDGLIAENFNFSFIDLIHENVTTDELIDGRENINYPVHDIDAKGYYQVCWIANTKHELSNQQDIDRLKAWLAQGNKKLIITYGHDEELGDNRNIYNPSARVSENVSDICQKLGFNIKPLFLESKGRYAEYYRDIKNYYNRSNRVPLPDDFVPNNKYAYASERGNLRKFGLYKGNPTTPAVGGRWDRQQALDPNFKDTLFTPIDTANGVGIPIARMCSHNVFNPRSTYHRDQITGINRITTIKTFNNSGYTKITFPVSDIQNSGYFIKVGIETVDPSETQSIQVVAGNVVGENFSKDDGRADGRKINLPFYDNDRKSKGSISLDAGLKIIGRRDVEIGPFYATSDKIDLYFSSIDMNLRTLPINQALPKSARIVYASGYPVPIVKEPMYKLVPVFKDVINPATPDFTIDFAPEYREISAAHSKYCPSIECAPAFDKPFNERGGPISLSGPEAKYLKGDAIVTIDGPVVVAQELEQFSPFSAGVARSRITVISDASLIQGQTLKDPNTNRMPNGYGDFIESLYPYTSFPIQSNGKQFSNRTKIRSPEIGSPAKWYSASGDLNLISRFNPQFNTPSRSAMSAFTGNESKYDPLHVHRPKFSWECEDAPPVTTGLDELFNQLLNAFQGSLNGSISSQFSGVYEGTIYRDNYQLYRDHGIDYLDFDLFPNGYPGDLFGFSIALKKKQLFVGSPFSAFSQEDKIVNWSDLSGTTLNTIPSGVELSNHGGAGSTYMFEKTLQGTSEIRGQLTDWQYMRKFRPNTINVGHDLTTKEDSYDAHVYGNNTYSSSFLETHSVVPDRFGYALDIKGGILAIGAPGHDFENYEERSQSAFQNNNFNVSADIVTRTIYDLGSSGTRNSLPNSGVTIMNNGAVYVYGEDYDFAQDKYKWSMIEKIVPQGYKTQEQFYVAGSQAIDVSGSENSHFGESVSVARNYRSDSDYNISVGSKNHPFGGAGSYSKDRGSSYTYDLVLRRQAQVGPDGSASISGRLFSNSGEANPKYPPINININNTSTPNEEFIESGTLYTTNRGEMFLEFSGRDTSIYNFINHRPFIESVQGEALTGTAVHDGVRLLVEGRPPEASGNMSLLNVGSRSDKVYNTLGMHNFGIDGIIEESGLSLYNSSDAGVTIFDSGLRLMTSGTGEISQSLNIQIRGF